MPGTRPPNRRPGQTPQRPTFRPPLGGSPASVTDIANTNVNFPQTNSVRANQIVQVIEQGGGNSSFSSVGALSGDVAGDPSANQIVSIQGVPFVGSLAGGQAWYQNGTELTPITISIPSLEQGLSGLINGSNKTFMLTKSYPYGFVLYADGMRLLKGVDYTAASLPTIVCTNAPIQWIIADYF